MTSPHDLDRQLAAFLRDGPTALPDPSFDAVRDRTEETRQRVMIGPWRFPEMNKFLPIGLGVAAVVVALVAGTQLLGPPVPGGPGGAPSASPTSAPSPSEGGFPDDLVVFTAPDSPLPGGLASTVTIAAPGWGGDASGGVLQKGEALDGAAIIGLWHEPLYVYGDPCQWSTTTPETPATTVDEVVAALASQSSRDASAPVDVTLDGYPGKTITLHVPEDVDVSGDGAFVDCDEEMFASWGMESEPGPARYHQYAGQIDEVWVVDIDGQATVIDGMYAPETPTETVTEMRAIVNSIDIEP